MQEDLLLEGAQRYDTKALADIFDAYFDRIHAYVYRRVGDPVISEDIAGEVFLRMLEAIQAKRGPHTNLAAWLYRVAHNLIVDHYRREAKTTTQPLEEWLVGHRVNPTQGAELEVVQEQLRKAIGRLTTDQQHVLILKFVEGLSNAHVGEILGKPEGAIKSLQHRALGAIRRQIEKGEVSLSLSDIRRMLE